MTEQQKLHLHQLQDKRESEAEHDKALAGQLAHADGTSIYTLRNEKNSANMQELNIVGSSV